MKSLLNLTVCILFCAELIYSQEIDLNQVKAKDREVLEKDKSDGLFKKNSLVLDVFTFSNFERVTIKSRSYYKNASFDFNVPVGGQIEFFPFTNWSIGLNFRYSQLSYTNTNYYIYYLDTFTSTWSKSFKTLYPQLTFNYHFPTGFRKTDISMGMGIGIYSELYKYSDTYYFGEKGYYNSFSYSLRFNYRYRLYKGLGLSSSLGAELYQAQKYFGGDFPDVGGIDIGNIPFHVMPSLSLGIFYKIM